MSPDYYQLTCHVTWLLPATVISLDYYQRLSFHLTITSWLSCHLTTNSGQVTWPQEKRWRYHLTVVQLVDTVAADTSRDCKRSCDGITWLWSSWSPDYKQLTRQVTAREAVTSSPDCGPAGRCSRSWLSACPQMAGLTGGWPAGSCNSHAWSRGYPWSWQFWHI